MALRGSQRQILQAIVDLPKDSTGHVSDSQIANLTKITVNDVRDWLRTLEDDGLVTISRSAIGFKVYENAQGRLELNKETAMSQISVAGLAVKSLTIRPKGLRAFDEEDVDCFLELLPGPCDQTGLPESISFWKDRIEGSDAAQIFRVGVISGPSGCGKTSFVKAGLLPKLSYHVSPVYAEATTDQTESRLLNGIRRKCSHLPPGLALPESIDVLRNHNASPLGEKFLLVIDQFEQWLLENRGQEGSVLARALGLCDGVRV
jgi:hypothetical protein